MKKLYFPALFAVIILLAACSKDFLKSYDTRIQGTWRLTEVKRFGFGSNSSPFQSGLFIFSDNGQLTYINNVGDTSSGGWDIRRRWVQGNCYSDDNGNRNCNDRYIRSLNISTINFTTQDFRSEYFDEIAFTGTNRFKAFIYGPVGTFVFYFKRQ